MGVELVHIIDQVGREKGIETSILVQALEAAVVSAYKKKHPNEELEAILNKDTGGIELFSCKLAVKSINDPDREITLKDAKKINPNVKMDELIKIPCGGGEAFGRVAAQIAKQVIIQKVREAETDLVLSEFQAKKGELVHGVILRQERGDIIVGIGTTEAILPKKEQVYKEVFKRGESIRSYLLEAKKGPKGAQLILSRTHPGLLVKLFQMEVPEIAEGIVEVKRAVREPNGRSKIAVYSKEKSVDAVGSCVGMRGIRIQAIVSELRGEKIDIVQWNEDISAFVKKALSPAKIDRIVKDEKEKHMIVIVQDDQLSLAIGKRGQNVRLASRLVGWSIDIKSDSEYQNELENKGSAPAAKDTEFTKRVRTDPSLGKEIANILIEHDLSESDKVDAAGVDGLTQISGIGIKTAELILDHHCKLESRAKNILEADIGKVETFEIDDYSISELQGVGEKMLKILNQSGYQTVAELSVAEIDELVSFEGIGAKKAEAILKSAREFMDEHE